MVHPDFSNLSILHIAYKYPPSSDVGAKRHFYFSKEMCKAFKQYHLLTKDFKEDQKVHNQIIHTKVSAYDYKNISKSKARSGAMKFLSRVKESFPFNLILGEGGLIYIFNGIRKGNKIIEKNNIHFLFSSFRPYADHYIAYRLKKRYPHLYWIADFRDPHVDPIRKNVVWTGFQHWCNAFFFNKADLITTVSNGLKEYLSRYSSNIVVLRNGYSTEDKQGESSYTQNFVINYTGSLYPGLQDPEPLFSVLKTWITENSITDLRLQYAGRDRIVWDRWIKKYELENINHSTDLMDHSSAISQQEKSHINLLLTWNSKNLKGILTAKLFEYIRAGNPILALINGKHDTEIQEIIQASNHGIVFHSSTDKQKIKEFLDRLYTDWKNQNFKKHKSTPALMEDYSWERQIQSFMPVLYESYLKSNPSPPTNA